MQTYIILDTELSFLGTIITPLHKNKLLLVIETLQVKNIDTNNFVKCVADHLHSIGIPATYTTPEDSNVIPLDSHISEY